MAYEIDLAENGQIDSGENEHRLTLDYDSGRTGESVRRSKAWMRTCKSRN
jgi:hypothetical protein